MGVFRNVFDRIRDAFRNKAEKHGSTITNSKVKKSNAKKKADEPNGHHRYGRAKRMRTFGTFSAPHTASPYWRAQFLNRRKYKPSTPAQRKRERNELAAAYITAHKETPRGFKARRQYAKPQTQFTGITPQKAARTMVRFAERTA